MNLEDRQAVQMLFANECFDKIINLAAQAGVRYSIQNHMLREQQCKRFPPFVGRVSSLSRQALGVRFFEQCVWTQWQGAFQRARQHRSS